MGVAAAKPNSCKFKDTAAEAIQHHSKGSAVAVVGLGWMESTIPHNTACVAKQKLQVFVQDRMQV